MFQFGSVELIDWLGGIAWPLKCRSAAERRPRQIAEQLVAAVLLFTVWSGVLAETIYTHGTGLPQDIVSFDSGGGFIVFGLIDLRVISGTGTNWAAYTLQLPDASGQPSGSLVGATLTGGAFSALIVSPDFHYIGAAGGVVTAGWSFSRQFGLNYQRQRLVGAPTLITDDLPVPYEPPPELVGLPPLDEWVDLGDTECPGCWPSAPRWIVRVTDPSNGSMNTEGT